MAFVLNSYFRNIIKNKIRFKKPILDSFQIIIIWSFVIYMISCTANLTRNHLLVHIYIYYIFFFYLNHNTNHVICTIVNKTKIKHYAVYMECDFFTNNFWKPVNLLKFIQETFIQYNCMSFINMGYAINNSCTCNFLEDYIIFDLLLVNKFYCWNQYHKPKYIYREKATDWTTEAFRGKIMK